MDDRQQHLKDLIDQALELPESAREAFLAEACADDAALLAEALDLLAYERPGPADSSLTITFTPDLPDLSGRTIGPYKVVQPIGEGGMGVVYLAAQSAPLRRQVALKVIKLGMDTREVIARFGAERQALALMDHPNIAKVLDAGATDEGRPYFVMEYIQGVPLVKYCEQRGLGLRARLDLFVQICHGIQHAHQKGIIHRDIKPANILVIEQDGRPVPKIIDFGVAKAVGPQLAAQTQFTQLGRLIGTPEYMSPEQANPMATDIDTRADVYSLGVVLYELLTGTLPLARRDILQAGFEAMVREIRDVTPLKPSTRLLAVSTQGHESTTLSRVDTRMWEKRVRGDLDWITMKALAKERERRYRSPADLMEDIGRHLANQPVQAGPPSRIYRARKFVRRNRAGVAAAVAIVVALVGFGVWQTVQSRIVARERDRALANERLSYAREKVVEDPTVAIAYALSSLEILDQPAARDIVRRAVAHGPLRDEISGEGLVLNPTWVDTSPDGRHCVVPMTGIESAGIAIYDLSDYSRRLLKSDAPGECLQAVYNADGSRIAALGTGGIHVWRVADGEHILHLPELGKYPSSVLFRLRDPHKFAVCANQIGEHTRWYELDLRAGTLSTARRSRGKQDDQAVHLPAITSDGQAILDYDGSDVFLQSTADLDSVTAILVGHHEAAITSVAMSPSGGTGVSADQTGRIMVWDLTASPPRLKREFSEPPGTWFLSYDPYGERFVTTYGSGVSHVYDLSDPPRREPVALRDRTYWVHAVAFLPDRTLVTSRSGVLSAPIAVWKSADPMAWALDLSDFPGPRPLTWLAEDGDLLYLWTDQGDVVGVPLADDVTEGVGLRGRSGGWSWGVWLGLAANPSRNRFLTYSAFESTHELDLQTGKATRLPGLEGYHELWELSPDGRWAGFTDLNDQAVFLTFDLDSMRVDHRYDLGSDEYQALRFSDGSTLLALGQDHLARFDLSRPDAPPDTLWRGDASGGGDILEDRRSVVVRDADRMLRWVDLTSPREVELGRTPRRSITAAAYDPDQRLLVVAGWWDVILVFDLDQGLKWTLPSRKADHTYTIQVWLDPRGRRLLASYNDQIVAWNLPLDPIFRELPHDEMLAAVRRLTNVRVAPDRAGSGEFRLTLAPAR